MLLERPSAFVLSSEPEEESLRLGSKKIRSLLKFQGQVWQAQYHDHAIRKDEVLAEVALYCLNNPVRAGVVKDFHEYPYWYCRYEV
jgi:hypothetical protein